MKGLIENLLARAMERDSIIDAYFDTALRERETLGEATDLETRVLKDALRSQLVFWQDFLMRTSGLTGYGIAAGLARWRTRGRRWLSRQVSGSL